MVCHFFYIACLQAGIATNCTLAIPTYGLWYACYITIMIMVAVVIPFTMFYYEADSETCVMRRVHLTRHSPVVFVITAKSAPDEELSRPRRLL